MHNLQREMKAPIFYRSEQDTSQGLYVLPIMHPHIHVGHLHCQYSYPIYRRYITAVYYIVIEPAVIRVAIMQAVCFQ